MKKSILTRALVCGILVSSFAIINCQKAPQRSVKPEDPPPAAKPTAVPLPDCSADVVKAMDANDLLKKPIQDVIDADKATPKPKLSDDDKKKLDANFKEYSNKSNELYTQIRALTKDKPADGCIKQDPKDAKNTRPYPIGEMQQAVKLMAADVARISGIANDLASLFDLKKVYLASANLAQMLSDAKSYDAELAISAGQILDKAAYDAMKADTKQTSCIVTTTDKKPFTEKAEFTITALGAPTLEATSKRTSMLISMSVKADKEDADQTARLMSFTCTIADGKDATEESTLAFKGLLLLKLDADVPAAAPQVDPKADPQADPNAAPQVDPKADPNAVPQVDPKAPPQVDPQQAPTDPEAVQKAADQAALNAIAARLNKE